MSLILAKREFDHDPVPQNDADVVAQVFSNSLLASLNSRGHLRRIDTLPYCLSSVVEG
jgi:hypothetical protein